MERFGGPPTRRAEGRTSYLRGGPLVFQESKMSRPTEKIDFDGHQLHPNQIKLLCWMGRTNLTLTAEQASHLVFNKSRCSEMVRNYMKELFELGYLERLINKLQHAYRITEKGKQCLGKK
jgi:hypothetical protein